MILGKCSILFHSESLIDRLIDWLFHWSTDWSLDRLIDWLIDCFLTTDLLIYWFIRSFKAKHLFIYELFISFSVRNVQQSRTMGKSSSQIEETMYRAAYSNLFVCGCRVGGGGGGSGGGGSGGGGGGGMYPPPFGIRPPMYGNKPPAHPNRMSVVGGFDQSLTGPSFGNVPNMDYRGNGGGGSHDPGAMFGSRDLR